MKKSVHEKAIRLIEGGIVEVDGLCVKLGKKPRLYIPCYYCEMDSLCHIGNEMCEVCKMCDNITRMDCFLILITNDGTERQD